MKKLILILLAFLAVFTYIRASENIRASEKAQAGQQEIPVEFVR